MQETKHPFLANVGMKTLYSKRDDEAEVTCFIVRCSVGSEIEEHVHPDETDIIYVLKGKARMWIEDRGEFILEPGLFRRMEGESAGCMPRQLTRTEEQSEVS